MKKFTMMIVVLTCWLALPVCSMADQFVITDYGLKEFAVKDKIERQAEEMVKNWGTKKPAKIIIQGFADKTGKTAENDVVARDRASEMKAFLETKVDAKITAISKGDLEDARKVVVDVEFAVASIPVKPIPASANTSKEPAGWSEDIIPVLLLLGLVMSLILLFFAFAYWARIYKKLRKAKIMSGAEKIEQTVDPYPTTTTSNTPIEFTFCGQSLRCYPEVTGDGRIKTFHELEPGKFRFVSNEQEWKKSVRSTFNKSPDLIPRLVALQELHLIA